MPSSTAILLSSSLPDDSGARLLIFRYRFDAKADYLSTLIITPHVGELVDAPELLLCSMSGRKVPSTCLGICEISGVTVLQHLLVSSEISQRLALPEFAVLLVPFSKSRMGGGNSA